MQYLEYEEFVQDKESESHDGLSYRDSHPVEEVNRIKLFPYRILETSCRGTQETYFDFQGQPKKEIQFPKYHSRRKQPRLLQTPQQG